MKITYRGRCFETNSSSMHSIIITTNDDLLSSEDVKSLLRRGNKISVDIDEDDFGRGPFRLLTTVNDKLAYVIASYCGNGRSNEEINEFLEKLNGIIKEKCPDYEGINFENEEPYNVFLDKDGEEIPYGDVEWEDDDEYSYRDNNGKKYRATPSDIVSYHPVYGGIDHQSCDLLQNFLSDRNVSLSDFIFNRRYVIVIDGDEYCELDHLLESGIIPKENIVENYRVYDIHDWEEIDDRGSNE